MSSSYDVVVVGSGPNGLSAAVRLAQAGKSVLVLEANEEIGGGTRSSELTLPGFVHDLCSAVHPMGAGSPYLRGLPLENFGLKWIHPELPFAHPLDHGCAAVLERSVIKTAEGLGTDGDAYHRLLFPLVAQWRELADEVLQPMLHIPKRPLQMARFGWVSATSCEALNRRWFHTERARALMAGLAAHSFLPLSQLPSSAFGLVLAMFGHAVGWPMACGGSQSIADALAGFLRSLGGEIRTDYRVDSLEQIPKSLVTMLDLTPRQLLRIAGERLPATYRRSLERFRYGPGIFKVDYALDGPIPWRAEECCRAGTVHVGGKFEDIAAAELEVSRRKIPDRPFVLLAQPTLFDFTRAPAGKHIAWAYCHVPANSSLDMTERIEAQIERFAPGFRDRILGRHTSNCAELELKNANLIGGSIDGGASDLRQLLARPVLSASPYRTPVRGVYLCSSSTPPGGGVHGMCGFHAAETAIRDWFS